MANARTAVDGLQAEIEELKGNALWLSAAPVVPAAFALYVNAMGLPDQATGSLPGVILLLLAPAVWWLIHKSRYRIAALALVAGLSGANLLLIHTTGLEESIIFLASAGGIGGCADWRPHRRRRGRRLFPLSAVSASAAGRRGSA